MRSSFSFICLAICSVVYAEGVIAVDRAVNKLLQGTQPERRSQIITKEKLTKIEKANRLAKEIALQAEDGMVQIPEGVFLMGDEKRQVSINKSFRLDIAEVSNRDYRRFLTAVKQGAKRYAHVDAPSNNDYTPRYWQEYRSRFFKASAAAKLAPFDKETFKQADNPVVGIDWWDAYAFCRWAGKRLPSEREWEKGARGDDGRIWPWGNEWDYSKANTGGDKWGEVDGYIYAAEVISFGNGASPYGLLNMAGNVAEWSEEGSVMGGSSNNRPSGVRANAKQMFEKSYRSFNIGFRCAADV